MPYSDPDRQRTASRDWKRRNVAWFHEFKKTLQCARCGFSHPAAIEFHHTGGDKEGGVSKIATSGASPERVLREIAKCEVLCANCHAIEHFNDWAVSRAGLATMLTSPRKK